MHVSPWFAASNATVDKCVASRNWQKVNGEPTISRLCLKIL